MRYFRVLSLSLAIHILIAAILLIWGPEPMGLDLRRHSFVELVEKPELPRRPQQKPKNEQQFVRSVNIPDQLLAKLKKPTKYSSEEDRTVLEQQKARLNDLTANRSGASGQATTMSQKPVDNENSQKSKVRLAKDALNFKPSSPLQSLRKDLDEANSIKVAPSQEAARASSPKINGPQIVSAESGFSTLGESLPADIKFGDFTALNTDRHLYYTFYARLEEKIRHRWVTYARAAYYSLPADPKKATGKDQWSTKLEVILDEQGHFQKAILHESSGIKSFDNAPVQALRDAGQFPNPPAEMKKADGFIHVYYSFSINYDAGAYAGH